jgi:solute:Na+ symporter, SSS family
MWSIKMENIVSIIFLTLTALSYVVVAALASRGISTKEAYLLGERRFNIPSITLTLIATQLGAGMLFGTASEAYNFGIFGIAYVFGMALGLIILGLGIGARLRSLNISTTAELFEKKYNSRLLRQIAAGISILTMGGILAAQIVASRQLFISLFDISLVWLVIFWIIIIAYTTFGGIKAIVATDILQVIMIVLVFTVVLFYIIPISEFSTVLSSSSYTQGPIFSDGFFTVLIAPVLFSVIEQDLAQRCFAAKTKRVATISSLLAAAFLLIYAFVPILLGMYAKMSGISASLGQSPLILLFQTKLSSLGMTLVACALLAAICSTADSLLGAASTNLIADFLPADKKFSLAISRLFTLLLGIAALIIAFNFDDVIKIIVKSYEISISALFIPLVLAMYISKPSRLGAIFSVFFGTLTFLALSLIKLPFSSTLIALLVSLVGFLLGAMIERLRIS